MYPRYCPAHSYRPKKPVAILFVQREMSPVDVV